jgi:hypothetical protein
MALSQASTQGAYTYGWLKKPTLEYVDPSYKKSPQN